MHNSIIIILLLSLFFTPDTLQQDVPFNNLLINSSEPSADDGSSTIDNSNQGQGIPRQLVEAIPSIEERIRKRDTTFNFEDYVPPPVDFYGYDNGNEASPSENVEINPQEISTSTTTTIAPIQPKQRPNSGRRFKDPAARTRVRMRQRGNETVNRRSRGRIPIHGFPDRIPPAYQHLYPEPSSTTPQIRSRFDDGNVTLVTDRTNYDNGKSAEVDTDGFDRQYLRLMNDNIDTLVRDQARHLNKLDIMDERLSKLESVLSRFNSIETKLSDITVQNERLETQNKRIDSALYLLRRNSMQIKRSLEKLENNTPGLLQDLKTKIDSLTSTIENLRKSRKVHKPLNDDPNAYQNDGNSIDPAEQIRKTIPESCLEIQKSGLDQPDVYRIFPKESSSSFFVYCDNGWTVIQNRSTGELDFLRNWSDYKLGFGNLLDEFWLGLEKIYILTNYDQMELLVELEDFDTTKKYAYYDLFAVSSEEEGYSLTVLGKYKGNAGDSLRYHAGQKFSTYDHDQDSVPDGNCATKHMGAWWYKDCDTSNLNGLYLSGPVNEEDEFKGMYWDGFRGGNYSLKSSRMLIRPAVDKT